MAKTLSVPFAWWRLCRRFRKKRHCEKNNSGFFILPVEYSLTILIFFFKCKSKRGQSDDRGGIQEFQATLPVGGDLFSETGCAVSCTDLVRWQIAANQIVSSLPAPFPLLSPVLYHMSNGIITQVAHIFFYFFLPHFASERYSYRWL